MVREIPYLILSSSDEEETEKAVLQKSKTKASEYSWPAT